MKGLVFALACVVMFRVSCLGEARGLQVLVITSEGEAVKPFVEALEAGGTKVVVSCPLSDGPDSYISLLGRWKLRLDPHDEGLEQKLYAADLNTEDWWDFPIPGSYGYGVAWLRRSFTLEGLKPAERIWLDLTTAGRRTVWVNGTLVGGAKKTDITSAVRPGENIVALRIEHWGQTDSPGGLFWPVGLYRTTRPAGQAPAPRPIAEEMLDWKAALKQFDVVVLSTALRLWMPGAPIREFVRRGGGLLFVCDYRRFELTTPPIAIDKFESKLDEVHSLLNVHIRYSTQWWREGCRPAPAAGSWLAEGLDWSRAPRLPYILRIEPWTQNLLNKYYQDNLNKAWRTTVLTTDYQAPLISDDLRQSPLLLTNRFGAGRVGVWASGLAGPRFEEFTQWEEYGAFWHKVLGWLNTGVKVMDDKSAGEPPPIGEVRRIPSENEIRVDFPEGSLDGGRRVFYKLATPDLRTVYQMGEAEIKGAQARIPLPKTDRLSLPEEWAYDKAVHVKVGIVDSTAAHLLAEKTVTLDSLVPPGLSIRINDRRARETKYPWFVTGGAKRAPQLDLFVFYPDETLTLRVAQENISDKPVKVEARAQIEALVSGNKQSFPAKQLEVEPGQTAEVTWEWPMAGREFELFRMRIDVTPEGGPTYTQTKVFDCIKPWAKLRNVKEPHRTPKEPIKKMGFARGFMGPNYGYWLKGLLLGLSSNTSRHQAMTLSYAQGAGPLMPWGPFGGIKRGRYLDTFGRFPNGQLFWEWIAPAWVANANAGDFSNVGMQDWWQGPSYHDLFSWANLRNFYILMRERYGITLQGRTHNELAREIMYRYFDKWMVFTMTQVGDTYQFVRRSISHKVKELGWENQGDVFFVGCEFDRVPPEVFSRWEIDIARMDPISLGFGMHYHLYMNGAVSARVRHCALAPWWVEDNGIEVSRRRNVNAWWMSWIDDEGGVRPFFRFNPFYTPFYGGDTYVGEVYWQMYDLLMSIAPEEPIGLCFVSPSGVIDPKDDRETLSSLYRREMPVEFVRLLRDAGVPIGSFVADRSVAKAAAHADGFFLYPSFNQKPETLRQLVEVNRAGKPVIVAYSLGGRGFENTPLAGMLGVRATTPRHGMTWAVQQDDSSAGGLRGLPGIFSSPVDRRQPHKRYEGFSAYEPTNARSVVGFEGDSRTLLAVTNDQGRGPTAFYSLGGSQADGETMRLLAAEINRMMGEPLTFSTGTTGYGFRARGKTFLVVQEMTSRPQTATVRVKMPQPPGDRGYRAFDMNVNEELKSRWQPNTRHLRIEVPLRASTGVLIVVM